MKKSLVFTALFVASAFMPASATIINIPDNYETIQEGIDASSGGDTVRVESGTYVENIDFSGKNIVVGSWFLDAGDISYISSTIIDGNAADGVVKFESGETNDARITGFTIQNGLASDGGGIQCLGSSPTINYNTIIGNSATQYGGGIWCYDNANPTINYNTISGNSGIASGGGIFCLINSDPTINFNTISGNSTDNGYGGGIFCYLSNPTINNNTISENSANVAGGISCWESSPAISNNTISGNSATLEGGGIWCNVDASPTINYNTISGNSADLGGGIYCTINSNPTISYNTISGNSADARGGGMDIWNSNPVIINTIFWANSALVGPEIHLDGTSSPVITYCDVQGGWAGDGNIDCDPMFCDPENGNFYLDAASCCVGAGEGGVDIGAFGVGCGEEIPTLSEWGMIILALLLLTAGTIAVVRRRKAAVARTN